MTCPRSQSKPAAQSDFQSKINKQRESKQAGRLEDVKKRGQKGLSHSWHGSACKLRGQRIS